MNTKEQCEEKVADIFGLELQEKEWRLITRDEFDNLIEYVDYTDEVTKLSDFIRETREQAIKQERERIKDEIGHIFTCLCDIPEYTDKMALERLSKIWESL